LEGQADAGIDRGSLEVAICETIRHLRPPLRAWPLLLESAFADRKSGGMPLFWCIDPFSLASWPDIGSKPVST
jgi:hypothetical protein